MKNDITVKDGDFIEFGNSKLKVLHTPGHSNDSICLLVMEIFFLVIHYLLVIVVELIYLEVVHLNFIIVFLMYLHSLDDDLVLYPGHNYGPTEVSTIGKEKMTNMIMQKRTEQQFLDMMG